MSASCENCGGPGPLDEDSVCGDCVPSAAPSWSPAATGGPAWGAPQCLPSPRPGGRRCESCGGADVYGRLNDDGICSGCAAADQRAEAATYARDSGTVLGRRCENCGDRGSRLNQDGVCAACATHQQAMSDLYGDRRTPLREIAGLNKAHLL